MDSVRTVTILMETEDYFTAHQRSGEVNVFQSCLSVHGVGGPHVTITHHALDLTIQEPPHPGHVQTCSTWT